MRICGGSKTAYKAFGQFLIIILTLGSLQIFVHLSTLFRSQRIGQGRITALARNDSGFKVEMDVSDRGEIRWRLGNSWLAFVDLARKPGVEPILWERQKCWPSATHDPEIHTVYIVLSTAKQTRERRVARETSLGQAYLRAHGICAIFVIGESFSLENEWRLGNSWLAFVDLARKPGVEPILWERQKCWPSTTHDPEIHTVYIVLSTAKQTRERRVARETSLGQAYLRAHGICAIFVIGESFSLENEVPPATGSVENEIVYTDHGYPIRRFILEEAEKFGDLVMIDSPEVVVLSGFAWAQLFAPSAKYVGRIDVKTFVNAARLVQELKTKLLNHDVLGTQALPRDIADARNYSFRVGRVLRGSAMETEFAMGFAYFATMTYANMVLGYADKNESDFEPVWDDVYVTGRAAKALGAKILWIPIDYSGNFTFEIGCEGPRDWITDTGAMRAHTAPVASYCGDEFINRIVYNKLTWVGITERLRDYGYESCFMAYNEQTGIDQSASPGPFYYI
ncbi:unnamed protein product [Notodromas monacha]|uniref:Hexosyltransferase n=1 Tax=Notodromas monacha TaxID=399045 RepID=A0A7R9BVY8_9CRUS|nr:unnamed protein product [Notodromas monacha]CAG0922394.1 unnamed protein product [Notodromas monacha]